MLWNPTPAETTVRRPRRRTSLGRIVKGTSRAPETPLRGRSPQALPKRTQVPTIAARCPPDRTVPEERPTVMPTAPVIMRAAVDIGGRSIDSRSIVVGLRGVGPGSVVGLRGGFVIALNDSFPNDHRRCWALNDNVTLPVVGSIQVCGDSGDGETAKRREHRDRSESGPLHGLAPSTGCSSHPSPKLQAVQLVNAPSSIHG